MKMMIESSVFASMFYIPIGLAVVLAILLYWPKKRIRKSDIAEPNLYNKISEAAKRNVKDI